MVVTCTFFLKNAFVGELWNFFGDSSPVNLFQDVLDNGTCFALPWILSSLLCDLEDQTRHIKKAVNNADLTKKIR